MKLSDEELSSAEVNYRWANKVNLPCSAIIESIVYNDHWTIKEEIK